MNKSDTILVHSTSEGKLYIKEQEFFHNDKIRTLVERLLNSSVYKKIKSKETRVSLK